MFDKLDDQVQLDSDSACSAVGLDMRRLFYKTDCGKGTVRKIARAEIVFFCQFLDFIFCILDFEVFVVEKTLFLKNCHFRVNFNLFSIIL